MSHRINYEARIAITTRSTVMTPIISFGYALAAAETLLNSFF